MKQQDFNEYLCDADHHNEHVRSFYNVEHCIDYYIMKEATHFQMMKAAASEFADAVQEHVFICDECNEIHEDYTESCEFCPSQSVRVVHKGDIDL